VIQQGSSKYAQPEKRMSYNFTLHLKIPLNLKKDTWQAHAHRASFAILAMPLTNKKSLSKAYFYLSFVRGKVSA
jgi:hypothetical protein